MKTILVTGGAGYIGSHTVRELIKDGYKVVVLDSLENGHRQAVDPGAILEIVDTSDISKIREIFDKYTIDAVIDFSAYLAVGESMLKPEKYLKNNVSNFINLLDVMVEKNCRYIIKSSTAAVYGNPPRQSDIPWKERFTKEYIPESSALLEGEWHGKKVAGETFFGHFMSAFTSKIADHNWLEPEKNDLNELRIPMSIYGLSKLLDEFILNKYDKMHGIQYVALRYFNVCGAHPDGNLGDDKPVPSNLMTLSMLQALGKIPEIQIFGRDYDTPDGTGIRDYIHPCDLASGHIKALEYLLKGNSSNIFNLGTGQGASVLEVIAAVEKASGRKITAIDAPRRSGDPSISVSDASKANITLDWQTKYSLKEMAETAWHWHSTHPEGFNDRK